jgi:hypothetical protein
LLGPRFSFRASLGLVAATGVVAYLAWWYWDEDLRPGSLGNPIVMTPETPGSSIGIDCLAFLHKTVSLWDARPIQRQQVRIERRINATSGSRRVLRRGGAGPATRPP